MRPAVARGGGWAGQIPAGGGGGARGGARMAGAAKGAPEEAGEPKEKKTAAPKPPKGRGAKPPKGSRTPVLVRAAQAAKSAKSAAKSCWGALANVPPRWAAGAALAVLLAAFGAYIQSTSYGKFYTDMGVYSLYDFQFDAFLERTPGTVIVEAYVPGMQAQQFSMHFGSAKVYNDAMGKSEIPVTYVKMNLRDAMRTRINLLGDGLFDTYQINQAMGGTDVKLFALTDTDPGWTGTLKTAPRRKTNIVTILRSYFRFFGWPRHNGGKYVRPLRCHNDWISIATAARQAHLPRYVQSTVPGIQDILRDSNFTVPVLFLDPDAPDGNDKIKRLYAQHSEELWDQTFYIVQDLLTVVEAAFDIGEPSFAMMLPEILRNPHEDSFPTLSLSDDVDNLEDNLKKHYISNLFNLVGRLDARTVGRYMSRLKPIGPFIKEVRLYSRSAKASENFAELVQILSPLAKKYRDHAFHVAPIDDDIIHVPMEEYNFPANEKFEGEDLISELRVGITYHGVRPEPQPDQRFTMRTETTVENIAKFIEEVGQGRHKAKYKSQPKANLAEDGRPQMVVGDTFKELVLESDKDVFILFYSVYTNECMQALALWERLAAKRMPGILFATFDVKENEFPDEALRSYLLMAAYDKETTLEGHGGGKGLPGMIYYKRNARDDPALYSGPHNLEELEEFAKTAFANPAKPVRST